MEGSGRGRALLALALLPGLAACAPISPELAARQCEAVAREAAAQRQGPTLRPTGKAELGVGSEGVISDVDVGFVLGYRVSPPPDPYRVYDQCVRRKSGQGPIRPLVL
ncbi:hypothetical protein DXV76_16170 [Rhodobacteraceae bacterium CCMM004]|nr:hypothetical protein DXV76_16170 [Rhodobacteraceae bacterium CCMM004]